MGVGVATEAAGVTQVSAAEDARVSVVAPVELAWLAATVEPALAALLAAMVEGSTHPESQRDGMAAMGKGTTHHEPRLEGRFIVLLRVRKVGLLRGSPLGRQNIRVAITSREINLELALPGNPTCNPVTIREQIAISANSAPLPLQGVQHDPAALGHGRI
jgi:hypothetical protein